MSKLIVLSNRVSLPNPDKPAAGGLAVALQDALDETGGIWLGWNGEQIADTQQPEFSLIEYQGVEYLTCPLSHQQYAQYYCGFANNTLWPAMHERADLIYYDTEEYQTYQQVNRLFAEKLHEIAQPEDVIWVHDYHFFSVARYCRELGMTNKIGFFLHIPFAHLSIWRQVPTAARLIQDLCQYDVVGLQTEHDQNLCMQACTTLLQAQKIQQCLLSYQQRITTIKCYPIGVNPAHIQKVAQQYAEQPQPVFDFSALKDQQTIIGVDRIDYSKGLLERFNALAEFLAAYPTYHRQVTDLQIACPCRMDIAAYQHLFAELKNSVEQINEKFAQDGWLPIHCSHEVVAHQALMGIYRQSDICWISSLRDGMNLVAKEYIAAQDPADPGVLILSQYTGAAEQMPEAIIVDPQDSKAMVNALKTALDMPKAERIRRYQQLMAGLKAFDINDWRNAFLSDLRQNNELHNFKRPGRDTVNPVYQLL